MNDRAKPESEAHPGAALKAARERRGASIASVATSAHLDQSLVEALEEGRYDAFHAPAYVYGYVRSYARFVGLDGDALVERLDVSWEDSPRHPELPRPLKPPLTDRTQRYLGVLFVAVVAAVLIAAAVVLWMAGWSSDWLSWLPDDAAVETPEPADSPAMEDDSAAPTTLPPPRPATLRTGAASSDADATPRNAADAAAGIITSSDDPAETVAPGATAAPTSAADGADGLVQAGTTAAVAMSESLADNAADEGGFTAIPPDVLALVFDDDSWVEVEDARGEVIHADLGTSGESYSIYGQAPFRIVVGYAPGVQIDFNGDPVALAPHTQASVARLVVGL